MAGDSISPNGKTGSPGKHYVRSDCEMADENKRLFKGKTERRELLKDHRKRAFASRRGSDA
jgi:hypothetical protein